MHASQADGFDIGLYSMFPIIVLPSLFFGIPPSSWTRLDDGKKKKGNDRNPSYATKIEAAPEV
eukprot:scaffold288635_cov60-Attheya_sp.AAC.2